MPAQLSVKNARKHYCVRYSRSLPICGCLLPFLSAEYSGQIIIYSQQKNVYDPYGGAPVNRMFTNMTDVNCSLCILSKQQDVEPC